MNEFSNDLPTDQPEEQKKSFLEANKAYFLLGILIIVAGFGFIKNRIFNTQDGETSKNSIAAIKNKPAGITTTDAIGDSWNTSLNSPSDAFVVSNDGKRVVAFSEREVTAYSNGTEPVVLKNTARELFRSGAFLPNNEFVMGGETEVGVWNLTTGEKRLTFKSAGGVETVAASPDGMTAAGVAREDGRVWLWETQKGGLLKESKPDPNSYRSSIYYDDASMLKIYEVSNSRARILKMELPSMKTIDGDWFDADEQSLKFSVNGKFLEGGSTNQDDLEPKHYIYDGTTGAEIGKMMLGEKNGSAAMIDDKRAVWTDGNGIVLIAENMMAEDGKQRVEVLNLEKKAAIAATSSNGKASVIKFGTRDIVILTVPN